MRSVPPQLARLVNSLSRGRLKLGWWTAPYRSATRPIIIGGSPRTGSTLLRVLLDNHPAIWIGPENGVFQEGGRNRQGMMHCTGLSIHRLRHHYRRAYCLGEFVDRTMAEALAAQSKPLWGIKSPSVVDAMETVFSFFPHARFIHIVRDGRDVVCSLRNHPKYRNENGNRVPTGIINPWDLCVDRWVRSTNRGLAFRGKSNYYEIRYESLVEEPESTIKSLLDWLELPFHPEILNHHQRKMEEGVDSPHPEVRQSIYQKATSRWKRDLTDEACRAFTFEACQLLLTLGYTSDLEDWKLEVCGQTSPV